MDHKHTAEQMLTRVDRESLHVSDDQLLAAAQVHATLALEAQTKRIADALEAANSYEPPTAADGRYRLDTDLENM